MLAMTIAQLAKNQLKFWSLLALALLAAIVPFLSLSVPCVVLYLVFHLHYHDTQTISINFYTYICPSDPLEGECWNGHFPTRSRGLVTQ